MGYIKVQKNKSYFKRFQVKYRRRREGLTDYYARRRLVAQDKTKYNTPKYRFVVRLSRKDVVCQIVSSTVEGDRIHCVAYSHELPRYGVKLGLTNYAAVYATGLLCGRRMLSQLGLDSKFQGTTEVTGEHFLADEEVDGRRPFKCFLDIGLARTTTGARVFAALKGAVDAGLNIPHSDARFPGWSRDEKKLDAAVLRKYIFGGHVAEYMESLEEEDEEAYNKQFGQYVKEGIAGDQLEGIYKAAHAAIRENPAREEKKAKSGKPTDYSTPKRTLVQFKARVQQILAKRAAAMADGSDHEDEGSEDDV